MKMQFARWIGGAAVAVALTAAGTGHASTLTVTGWNQPSGAYNIDVGNLGSPANGRYSAGRFELTTSQGNIFTWCVDVFRTLTANQIYQSRPFENPTVTNGNPSAPVALTVDQVNAVKGLALAGNAALDTAGPNTGLFAGIADNIVSAAVQAAIWEVINPAGTFTAHGGSQANRTALNNLFNALVNPTNLATFRTEGATVSALWLTAVNPRSGQGQGQIWIQPGGGSPNQETPVPAPAAVLFLGLGLLGLAAVRRKA